MIALLLGRLFGTQKNLVGVIVTVGSAPDGIAIFRVIRIIAHRCLGLLHSLSADLYCEEIGIMSILHPLAAETLEIANLGFTTLADEIHHRIALSGVGRLAADLFILPMLHSLQ